MKALMIIAVLTGVLAVTGCGDGNSNNPSAAASPGSTDAAQPGPAPVQQRSVSPTSTFPPDNSGAAFAPDPANPVQNAAIDPPSPPISMSAGVTETVDPPRPASALGQTIAPTNDDTSSVAAEQVTPVVHYPPDPATGSDN
jgi:hypothetical protein